MNLFFPKNGIQEICSNEECKRKRLFSPKPCIICGKMFIPKQSNHNSCSKECSYQKSLLNNRIYGKENRKNPHIKIRHRLSTRIRDALTAQNYKHKKSIIELLGCDIDFLVNYLEKNLSLECLGIIMGFDGWHIDHIKPCASFDLTDKEEQKNVFIILIFNLYGPKKIEKNQVNG